ncbi:MAG: ABC transporter ATP-binding protein [Thiotrichales bacterium]|nr:ABC transporter ATP-binding protein [Thiotrichales bacterium]|tara:strand:+ start:305 stop:1351 length:1047 start_codon:yes stop_codon:yes gene_type:complete
MVKIEQLSVSLSAFPVIRGVTLDVEEGEFLCLLGPSGCGKTTTLRSIAGFEVPEQGRIQVGGRPVVDGDTFVPPQKRNVGMLFQDLSLFPHLTIRANIGYGLRGGTGNAIERRVDELLDQIKLREHADKYPHMLSGGQQQRVALARALAPNPRVMLLDEPFSGLDVALRSQVRDETVGLLKAASVTTIMVTHDPEEAMLCADRIALMRDGRIVQMGTPGDIYDRPVNAFAARFLSDVNCLEGRVDKGAVQTSLCRFPTDHFSEGSAVDVYIRPEAVSMRDGREDVYTARARVCEVHVAGAARIVKFGVDGDDHHAHLEVRFPRSFSVSVGETIDVQIDKQQTYLFERD